MEPREVARAIEALVAAPRPEDGLAVLRDNEAALLSPEALRLFDSNIERLADDPDTRDLLRNRRLIVSEFQRSGIEGAERVMRGPVSLGDTLNAWLACDGWDEAFEFLVDNQALLLSHEADELLAEAANRYANDPHGGPKVNACRALAGIARENGLVEARRWLCRQLLAQLNNESSPDIKSSYYCTLLELTDKDEDAEAWLAINVNYGTLLRELDQPDAAISHFKAALEVITPEASPEHYSGVHRSLGNVYLSSAERDTDKAIYHFTEALRTLDRESDPANFLHVHHMLGNARSTAGQRETAIFHLRKAAALPVESNPEQWAQVCADLAGELTNDYGPSRQPSLQEAIELLDDVLERLDPVNDLDRWARSHRNIGMAYRDIESSDRVSCLEKAIDHTSVALSAWTQERNPYGWAQLQHNLGTIYYSQTRGDVHDNLTQAASHYSEALSVHTRDSYPDDWALTKSATGMCEIRFHDLSGDAAHLDAAIEQISASLEWWAGEGNSGSSESGNYRAEAANALGGALAERGRLTGSDDLRAAVARLSEAETLYATINMPERRRAVLMNLASAYEALSDVDPTAYPLAVEAALRALAATHRDTDSYTWALFKRNYAALLVNSGDPASRHEAIGCLNQALEVFTREPFLSEHSRTCGFLGHVHFQNRGWQKALDAYTQAAEAAEEVIRGAYTETGQGHQIADTSLYFMRAAYCLVELDRPGEALVMLDRGKGRALSLDLAVNSTLNATSGNSKELAAAHSNVAVLEAEMRLPAKHPSRRRDAELGQALKIARLALDAMIRKSGEPVRADLSLDEMLAEVPVDGALVSLLVTSEGTVAFVIPGGAVDVSSIDLVRSSFSSADLHAMLLGDEEAPGLLRTYLGIKSAQAADADTLQQRYEQQLDTCCRSIWRELLAPVAERLRVYDLAQNAPLVLLPQGGLGLLPLHAACDDTAASGQPQRWPLLDRYSISYAPSAYMLAACRQALGAAPPDEGEDSSLFAAINPTNDLDFAEVEGALLADLFTRHSEQRAVVVLRGDAASVAEVKPCLNRAQYLHFACHGAFNFRDAGRSALRLAGGQPLELAELMGPGIDLSKSRLVALSACETGMTEFQRSPDEYTGLPATFLRAGAPAVLSTLWEVDDISTSVLICEFYRRHVGEEKPPAQALREAQRWMSRAPRGDVAAWIDQAVVTLKKRDEERDYRGVISELDTVSRDVKSGVYGAVPFEDPWYWAAFTLTGN